MSGLVVRPGDVLVVPLAPGTNSTPGTRAKLKAYMEQDLPGVTVLVCEGPAGGPFVYRAEPAFIAMTDAEINALPDEASRLAEAFRRRHTRQPLSTVDTPVRSDTP